VAIKKSELYSSLWASCNELRGGMDASQYKDYVLVLLFIKYISDKYAGKPYAPIIIPKGASFQDMVLLKGKRTIGDDINKKTIAPLEKANKLTGMPNFNDPEKLGSGKEMVEKLTNLIAIFEKPELNFSKNRADGDDILGDAYEYLMRHFATESGKSKGQFYTPSEVSRVMAKIIGIDKDKTSTSTTVYDPTCGSGSLLLKVADHAPTKVTLYGQEKDATTAGLARMNMILHNNPTAEIKRENTLANPLFKDGNGLKTFDYVIANPPFSDKRWSSGVDIKNDPYKRFTYGAPPAKNGDYAYLLHIIRSLKSGGKGACILPHGVLFRGNTETTIRKALVQKDLILIKGIIGLPANLFYGTSIPACIVIIDKKEAAKRKGIFMIDASKGFIKGRNKNRLRDMDIHKIVDAFTKQLAIDGYSRWVPLEEIEKNEFNLNIPRYIDSKETEDLQDIEAHLLGDIPKADIEALTEYWQVLPNLKTTLFSKATRSKNYYTLKVDKAKIKEKIDHHAKFIQYINEMAKVFEEWKKETIDTLTSLGTHFHPKIVIHEISESLLKAYTGKSLINKYHVYQYLMDYWYDVMQDDCYLIVAEGWKISTYRIIEKNKKGKKVDKGWTCDLVPKSLVINRYFSEQQQAIDEMNIVLEAIQNQQSEMKEEHNVEDGIFFELDKINQGSITKRLKELKNEADSQEEQAILKQYLALLAQESRHNKIMKKANADFDAKLLDCYSTLSEEQIKQLVIEDKWMAAIEKYIHTEMDHISQTLAQRIRALAERYEVSLPVLNQQVEELENSVNQHLQKMGFVWN
jgi:type I restriction enzyme M protein